MNPISTLILTLILSLSLSVTSSAQNVYVDNGSNTTYQLHSGDSLYVRSGTYTGRINNFHENAKITVAQGASFNPEKFSNPKGALVVYGSAKFIDNLNSNTGFTLTNYGTIWTKDDVALNGSLQLWTNQYGATMRFDKGFTVNNNNTITNKGLITTDDDVVFNNNSILNNKNSIVVEGKFTANGAKITNEGKLQVRNAMTFNSGTTLTNSCKLIGYGGITNNTPTIFNNGLFWSPSANSSSSITNNSTITNGASGKIKAVNFTNWGTLKGAGMLYFTGTTIGGGNIGTAGSTTDTIKVYDVTRTNPSNIFDQQYGTVHSNVVYRVLTAPDTTNIIATCSMEFIQLPLPVKWNAFYVSISDNTPVLNWTAEHDPGTRFEIQRSYNGTDFTAIATINAEINKISYRYDDKNLSPQSTIVYYRIRAIEPDGNAKFSETRTLKLSNKPGAGIQASPNPFTSQFNISYQGEGRDVLTIKIYSLSGQLQFAKLVTTTKGYNSIAISEASNFAKGMYVVQVMRETQVVALEKMIKQ